MEKHDHSRHFGSHLGNPGQNLVVTSNLSYGGVKNSGLGKEASLEAMLEHFTHKKTIIVNMQ